MKKLFLLLVSGFLFAQNSFSQLLTQSFDNVTFPPTNWSLLTTNAGSQWSRATINTNTGAGCAIVATNSNYDMDTWLFTPLLSLNAGASYKVSYFQRTVNNGQTTASLQVRAGSAQTIASQTTTIGSLGGLNNTTYIKREHLFLAPTSGNFSFSFRCNTLEYGHQINIDDILIEEIPCTAVEVIGANPASNGSYCTLKAAFDQINNFNQNGNNIQIRVHGSIVESSTAQLNNGGWASLVIYPTDVDLSISGNLTAPLVQLHNAVKVVIDGRVNRVGSKSLVIENTSTSSIATTSTLRFINSCSLDTVKYAIIKGSTLNSSSGVIAFSTSDFGSGNKEISIENCDITRSGNNRPLFAVYSFGSTNRLNSEINIESNHFYNHLRNSGITETSAINIPASSFNNNWAIKRNSFFETTTFSAIGTLAFSIIRILNKGDFNFTISDNIFGGNQSDGSGLFTKTSNNNILIFCNINLGANGFATVNGNKIRNIKWTNTGGADTRYFVLTESTFDVIANQIGDTSTVNSVDVVNSNVARFYVFDFGSTANGVVKDNLIGSIKTTNSSSYNHTMHLINLAQSGVIIIENNVFGSLSKANSIFCSSASFSSVQNVVAINKTTTSGNTIIKNNIISNLVNGTINFTGTQFGMVSGIRIGFGSSTITNNLIQNLTIANANTNITTSPSASGINVVSATANSKHIITENIIINIYNSRNAFQGLVTGISLDGVSNIVHEIKNNFIANLALTGTSAIGQVRGITVLKGSADVFNNIIKIDANLLAKVSGINEISAVGETKRIVHNTIFLGGELQNSAHAESYGLFSETDAGNRLFLNNILYNSRSTPNATNKHFGIYLNYNSITGLQSDFQLIFSDGTASAFGYFGGSPITNLTNWQNVTNLDANSLSANPNLIDVNGNIPTDFIATMNLTGQLFNDAPLDFLKSTREPQPQMGAFNLIHRLWKGSINTNWANQNNWLPVGLPNSTDNILIALDVVNNIELTQAEQVGKLYFNKQTETKAILNNFNLMVSEVKNADSLNFIQTNGTGKLVMNIATDAFGFFPIGNSSFNPIEIKNNNLVADDFSVRVFNDVLSDGLTGTSVNKTRVNITWDIDKTLPNVQGVDFKFKWNIADLVGSIQDFALYHYDNTWQLQPNTPIVSQNQFIYNNYTGTFSPFAVGDLQIPLPVVFGDFYTKVESDNKVTLFWETLTENNAHYFSIQRSNDSKNWEQIGLTNAAGTKNTQSQYRFLDANPLLFNYYRIVQFDFDNASTFTKIVYVHFEKSQSTIQLYPNPTNGLIHLSGIASEFTYEILDLQGKIVENGTRNASNNTFELKSGVYLIRIYVNGVVENRKVVVF